MSEETRLATIVAESGLDESKAEVMLQSFQDYFKMAAEWEQKAKVLVVTSELQVAEMKMAREGRLFLREKRIAIEKTRKELKAQALREGKAIDGIANVLKALIVPVEKYLDKQEHFIEIREKAKAEAWELKVKAWLGAEKAAEKKRLAEEQEKTRQDNILLELQAEAKEEQLKAEREAAEAARLKVEKKAKAAAEKAKKKAAAQEAAAEKERQKAEARLAEEKAKAQKLLDEQIECPFCHKKFIPKRG